MLAAAFALKDAATTYLRHVKNLRILLLEVESRAERSHR